MSGRIGFRRVFIDGSRVCVELSSGERYALPNPTGYDPANLLRKIVAAGSIDMKRWKRMD